MRRRDQNAAYRRTVATVAVKIQDYVGDTWRGAGIDRLLEAELVKRAADCLA